MKTRILSNFLIAQLYVRMKSELWTHPAEASQVRPNQEDLILVYTTHDILRGDSGPSGLVIFNYSQLHLLPPRPKVPGKFYKNRVWWEASQGRAKSEILSGLAIFSLKGNTEETDQS